MNQESKVINVHLEKRENKDYLVFGFEEVAEVCLNDDVIERNPVLAEKLYEVQYCDIMAQDTKYLKDRVDYLTTTNYKLKKRRSRLYKKR